MDEYSALMADLDDSTYRRVRRVLGNLAELRLTLRSGYPYYGAPNIVGQAMALITDLTGVRTPKRNEECK